MSPVRFVGPGFQSVTPGNDNYSLISHEHSLSRKSMDHTQSFVESDGGISQCYGGNHITIQKCIKLTYCTP